MHGKASFSFHLFRNELKVTYIKVTKPVYIAIFAAISFFDMCKSYLVS